MKMNAPRSFGQPPHPISCLRRERSHRPGRSPRAKRETSCGAHAKCLPPLPPILNSEFLLTCRSVLFYMSLSVHAEPEKSDPLTGTIRMACNTLEPCRCDNNSAFAHDASVRTSDKFLVAA